MRDSTEIRRTPLHALHVELGAKMVPFAGYDMPVHYKRGILGEHLHTRLKAGLFDVSHMGQVRLDNGQSVAALENLVPANLSSLKEGRMRYTMLTSGSGGIIDDLIVTRINGSLHVILNAACKDADLAHMRSTLSNGIAITSDDSRALLAIQGPMAAPVLVRHVPGIDSLIFMSAAECMISGIKCIVSRSGYTGEDGFEISVAGERAVDLAQLLLVEPEVEPIGLGARDSLRLEAGLCLHGHDIDITTTPVEAGLEWTIGRNRREKGGFPGADIILKQLSCGTLRRRVGLKLSGRAIAREHSVIQDPDGKTVGEITSGGYSPTLNTPIAMGYVQSAFAELGTNLSLIIRGKCHRAEVVPMPFVPHNYARG